MPIARCFVIAYKIAILPEGRLRTCLQAIIERQLSLLSALPQSTKHHNVYLAARATPTGVAVALSAIGVEIIKTAPMTPAHSFPMT